MFLITILWKTDKKLLSFCKFTSSITLQNCMVTAIQSWGTLEEHYKKPSYYEPIIYLCNGPVHTYLSSIKDHNFSDANGIFVLQNVKVRKTYEIFSLPVWTRIGHFSWQSQTFQINISSINFSSWKLYSAPVEVFSLTLGISFPLVGQTSPLWHGPQEGTYGTAESQRTLFWSEQSGHPAVSHQTLQQKHVILHHVVMHSYLKFCSYIKLSTRN